jgi:hypothetical protein
MVLFLYIHCAHSAENNIAASPPKSPENLRAVSFKTLSIKDNFIVDGNSKKIMLRGFHFDCFSTLNKNDHKRIIKFNLNPYDINKRLSKHYFSQYDINKFIEMGANVVKINFSLWEIEKEPFEYSQVALNYLDEVIKKWGENGVYVILGLGSAGQNSLKHNKYYGNILWKSSELKKRVVALWRILAKRYRNNIYIAGYDILNEPEAPTKQELYNLYDTIIREIRKEKDKHIIFIQRNVYKRWEILFGGQYKYENIALCIHFYKPGEFTKQGIGGRSTGYKYPGKYKNIYWDKNRIKLYFKNFLIKHNPENKPLFVGEFSASLHGGGQYAIMWIKDVIETLNENKLHFTFFNYKIRRRNTWGLHKPTLNTNQRIRALKLKIANQKSFDFKALDEISKYFYTSQYESNVEAESILKMGFKGEY